MDTQIVEKSHCLETSNTSFRNVLSDSSYYTVKFNETPAFVRVLLLKCTWSTAKLE